MVVGLLLKFDSEQWFVFLDETNRFNSHVRECTPWRTAAQYCLILLPSGDRSFPGSILFKFHLFNLSFNVSI